MVDGPTEESTFDDVAEEFARRLRAGERPSIEEYAHNYPHWADEIRDVFPAVQMMEDLKPRRDDTGPMTPPASAGPPERIGDYRIIREIARGGMGIVYEAEQVSLGRRVALKVLPAHLLSNDTLRTRFHRESHAAARLHHTNIVSVFAVGEHDGLCYYVMQLIDGRGLDRILGGQGTGSRGQKTEDRGQKIEDRGQATESWHQEQKRASGSASPTHTNSGIAGTFPLAPDSVARIGVQVADVVMAITG